MADDKQDLISSLTSMPEMEAPEEAETDAAPEQAEGETAETEAVTVGAETAEADEKDEAEEKGTRVPLGALKEERKQRQALEAQLRQMQQNQQQLQDLFLKAQQIREEREKPKEPEAPKVKFEDSPLDYLKNELEENSKTTAKLAKEREEQQKQAAAQQQQMQQLSQFMGALRQDEAKFVAENEDYIDALNFSREITRAALEEYDLTPEQIEAQIKQAELQQAAAAMAKGKSPAATAYKIAKKLGYKPKAKESTQTVENANGADTNDAQMAMAAKRKAAAKGAAPSGLPSADDLAAMPADDFNAAFKSMFGQNMK